MSLSVGIFGGMQTPEKYLETERKLTEQCDFKEECLEKKIKVS